MPTVVPKNREKKDRKGRFTCRSRNRTIDKEAQDAHSSVKEMDDGVGSFGGISTCWPGG